MRRVYYSRTQKRKSLEAEALNVLRRTRRLIDPALIDRVCEHIKAASEQATTKANSPPAPDFVQHNAESLKAGLEPVDRKKNLTIVMKYIQANPENKSAIAEIQNLLRDEI